MILVSPLVLVMAHRSPKVGTMILVVSPLVMVMVMMMVVAFPHIPTMTYISIYKHFSGALAMIFAKW